MALHWDDRLTVAYRILPLSAGRRVRCVLDSWGRPHAAPGRTCGLVSTYNRGCRCDECREAARLHRRKYRRKQ